MKSIILFLALGVLPVVTVPGAAQAQSTSDAITGTVVSTSRNSFTVRTSDGRFVTFGYRTGAGRPAVNVGAQVSVSAGPDRDGIRSADAVRVTAAAGQGGGGETGVVPEEVRRLEGQIERQVRRYGVGVRGGIGFDPEILTAGVQARVGPFFNENISLRPSVEFGFGEVTTLVALNLEAIYRLPFTPRTGRWSAYLGAGPSFNFSSRDFNTTQTDDRDIDFSDLDYSTGLSFVTGMQFRNGAFVEMRSMAYGKPSVRVFVGYNF